MKNRAGLSEKTGEGGTAKRAPRGCFKTRPALPRWPPLISFRSSTPQFFEPGGISGGVPDGVLNIPVAEIILNEPRVRALIGKSEAASVAEHVGMGE